MRGRLLLIAGLALVACAKPSPAPAPMGPTPATPAAAAPTEAAPVSDRPPSLTDADVELAERTIAIMGKLGAAVAEAGADCPRAAEAVRALLPELRANLDGGRALDAKLRSDPAARAWFERTFNPRLGTAAAPILASACQSDPAFAAAMSELEK